MNSRLSVADEGQLESAWAQLSQWLGVGSAAARAVVGRWVDALDTAPRTLPYTQLPMAFVESLRLATAGASSPRLLRWLDLVLLEQMRRFEIAFERADVPDGLLPEFRENAARMLRRACQPENWARGVGDDVFLKDLGILRATLIPCASHVVFRHSGVPRSLILRQRPLAMWHALEFFARRVGGFAPFLENHVHPGMLAHFHAAGRERCYRLVAQLLQRWPDSRGLMGLSWYYDPAVAKISPRLAYLRDVPAGGGALFLPADGGDDVVRGAVATSPTRRRLYDEGRYCPTRYLMAWARDDLMDHVQH